ncbi:MAG TPA: 5-formyltetrahydrofolate cyclo-ligase [Firmicutes bacterium]|nr:5-formyltetrahydrofolate cyclo-ligase [Bacillota bacterium]
MDDSLALKKQELRKKLKKIRDLIPKYEARAKSLELTKTITGSEAYLRSESVMTYVSFGSEVQTLALIEQILTDKKNLFVPLCDVNLKVMFPVKISSIDQLELGNYGILEPKKELLKSGVLTIGDKTDIDLAIVPVLGFDKRGGRLGYGGGYYDRFLKGYTGFSVGIAFSECLVENVPAEKHDIKLGKIYYC